MHINYERSLTQADSFLIAEKAINHFDLYAEDYCYGDEFKSYHCKLMDKNHKLIFFGCGKGLGMQSKVSAYFEALEHYVIHHFSKNIADNKESYVLLDNYEQELPCVNLTEIHSNEKISYPIFMLDPRYAKHKSKHDKMNYLPFSYLANDSGVASGANMLEASIHALNELVERDAHSLFLIEAFVKNKNQNIKLIDKLTLPEYLQNIVRKIETQYSDDLMIFDITSDVGISVIYVSMTKQNLLIQPYGCGASLKSEYAVERALLETLQPLHIYNDKLNDNQQQIIKSLSDYPLLQNAAIAKVSNIRNKVQQINFTDVITHNPSLTLSDQLETIINKISSTGCKIFKLPIINGSSGFTCVKFLIPDFEKFYLVQTGKRVLPGNRGLRLLNNNRNYLC